MKREGASVSYGVKKEDPKKPSLSFSLAPMAGFVGDLGLSYSSVGDSGKDTLTFVAGHLGRSIRPFVHPFVHPSVHLSIHLSIHLSVHLSVHPFVRRYNLNEKLLVPHILHTFRYQAYGNSKSYIGQRCALLKKTVCC